MNIIQCASCQQQLYSYKLLTLFHNICLANGVVAGEGEPPEDDGTKGELTVGPGVGGIQPRWSECKRALPGLTLDQEERLKKAKRFAMEQSVQQVCNIWL